MGNNVDLEEEFLPPLEIPEERTAPEKGSEPLEKYTYIFWQYL